VDAADPAGAHEPDAEQPADRQRAPDGGGAERALGQARPDVPGADLAGFLAGRGEPLQLGLAQPGHHLAVGQPDRGRHRPGRADLRLGGQRRGQALAVREPVRDQRGFQRHHRPAILQCLGDLSGHPGLDHGIAPSTATARAAAVRPRVTPPSR
jgi:hypothetical protein